MSDGGEQFIHRFGGRASSLPYRLSEEITGTESAVMKRFAGVDAIIVKAGVARGRCRFAIFRPLARSR